MKTTLKYLAGILLTLAFSLPAQAALIANEMVAIDFGATPSNDPAATFNDISVGGSATTPGLAAGGYGLRC